MLRFILKIVQGVSTTGARRWPQGNQRRTNYGCGGPGLEEQRFAPDVETTAYRIVQEALTNVARHAGVSELTVRLWTDADTLSVIIVDQGRGFDLQTVRTTLSSGLAGMVERAALLGGNLTADPLIARRWGIFATRYMEPVFVDLVGL